uniref:Interleukin 17C n=1 Tax=Astatotilapia calliptera TaxID=8154 RepID=A0AAX7VC21_ASTCA
APSGRDPQTGQVAPADPRNNIGDLCAEERSPRNRSSSDTVQDPSLKDRPPAGISLLILHELCAAASNSTCLSAEKVEARERKFDVNLKKLGLQRDAREDQNLTTCEQAAQQMHELNGRALSPWHYYIDRNDSRYPRDIIFAECLCKGCIIDGREVNDYNSVEVRAPMVVLMKTKCKDADTYRVQKTRIEVPVGCTCVRPKITK